MTNSTKTAQLEPYTPGPRAAGVDLKLDGNEGAAPAAWLRDALQAIDPSDWRLYPSAAPLEALIAAQHGVGPEQVIVTAGADEALDRVCRAFLGDDVPCVLPKPTFVMLERYAALAGADVRSVPWPRGEFPTDAVIAAAGDDAAMIAVVSPNNPTGAVATLDALARLSAARPDAVLLVDLAYTEFARVDLTAAALALPNAIVTRTLSKAFGLAGLRIGYAIGASDTIRALRSAGGPYPVSTPSLVLAEACLSQPRADTERFIERVRVERGELVMQLARLGANPQVSDGNFVYVTFDRVGDARRLHALLGSLGIAVRLFADDNAVRITCPGDEQLFMRLTAALDTAWLPDALLFDMDGVLVDVSRSFRAAIVATAASYGVDVSDADIAATKRAGNANCDWELTRRLVNAGGARATLDEVTERFERFYQGTESEPGLRELETSTVSTAWLESLAASRPLAVVTGRPRADALRALDVFGWANCFDAVVCREDGIAKPAPDLVLTAMNRLDANTAWMVGDTPDDIVAARRADVVSFGVIPPGTIDTRDLTAALRDDGAAEVFTQLTNLKEWLR